MRSTEPKLLKPVCRTFRYKDITAQNIDELIVHLYEHFVLIIEDELKRMWRRLETQEKRRLRSLADKASAIKMNAVSTGSTSDPITLLLLASGREAE